MRSVKWLAAFAAWFRRRRRQRVLICMRLDEMFFVHPRQITRKCHECAAVVGIYPSGQRILRRYRKTKIVCNHCGMGPAVLAPGAMLEGFESRPRKP